MAFLLRPLEVQNFEITQWSWINQLTNSSFVWTTDLVSASLQEPSTQLWVLEPTDFTNYYFGYILGRRVDVDTFEILSLAIHPTCVGQGFMFRAITKMVDHLHKMGVRQVWLEVHEQNRAAQSLYARLGFQENARRQRYYQDGGAGLLMSLTISP